VGVCRDEDGGNVVMIGRNELVWEGGYIDFCLSSLWMCLWLLLLKLSLVGVLWGLCGGVSDGFS